MNKTTRIIGNGDVSSYKDGLARIDRYGVDSVMVGTGIFRNPWFFGPELNERSILEKTDLLLKHVELYTSTWGDNKRFDTLKRFFKIYVNEFRDAALLRDRLMRTNSAPDVAGIITDFKREASFSSA